MKSLTGSQKKALVEALVAAYPYYPSLQQMLEFEVEKKLALYAPPGPMKQVAFDVVTYAVAEGWIERLVTGAALGNPDNPQLVELLRSGALDRDMVAKRALADPADAGVLAVAPQALVLADVKAAGLERVIKSAAGFTDLVPYATALLEQAARVCSIRSVVGGRRTTGTGFLVGPDLVLTNYHVLEGVIENGAPSSGVAFNFDYHVEAGGGIDFGSRFPLAPEWLVASSRPSAVDLQQSPTGLPGADELDYALVRVAGAPGLSAASDGRRRGWVDLLATPPALDHGLPLLIIQHPEDHPLKLAVDTDGVLAVNGNGTRVTYAVNTLGGSSGSPCFTFGLALAALHHSASPADVTRNEGIPIAAIAAHLRAGGHAGLLGG